VLEELGRIRFRLLFVNLIVLLVPIAGLEFARLYERQLLDSLERDMRDQAVIVGELVQDHLQRGMRLEDSRHARLLAAAARRTRTRIRLLDMTGSVAADSHSRGPPEGAEPPPPYVLGTSVGSVLDSVDVRSSGSSSIGRGARALESWPAVPQRVEVSAALRGRPSSRTRIRRDPPGVFLFVAQPIWRAGSVHGVVYVARSTHPVLVELYRIRSGLLQVLFVAIVVTALVTLLLAWSISRPLAKLSRAATRISAGERDVVVPVGGSGEIRELGEAFAVMTERLDARHKYISDFAADVAHEFKSPLTSIRGAAELLGEGAADDPDARRRFLRNIELDVERLDRLVVRLLELSRIEASSEVMTIVDLEALVTRVAQRSRTHERPILVRYDARSRLVRAREADLETAVVNLVDNALRFSPPGAAVEIRVEGGGAQPLGLSVIDRGPGIDAATLPRIFDRFFTTDRERKGTGLGLAIVKSVASAHGGEVLVSSKPGAGARFTLLLPALR